LFAVPVLAHSDSFPATVTPLNDTAYAVSVSSLLKDAKVSIRMIMYVAKNYPEYPDSLSNNLLKELIASAKKGVKVEVILDQSDPKSSSDKTDNLQTASYLSANGVSVYLDTPEKTTHAKLIIVDEKYVVLGSSNWTYHSLAKNNETNVIMTSPELARHYTKYFERVRKECRTKLSKH
jgi:phosphatidylserine/phosphatidylglycerophosphate/cardiolipin synthase-like enzyme